MNRMVCPKGHFYNGDKYSQCPHCIDGTAAVQQDGFVFTLGGMADNLQSKTQEIKENHQDDKVTMILPRESLPDSGAVSMPFSDAGTGKSDMDTKVVTTTDFLPVGYLVCIRGSDYGRSFPLRTGVNPVKEQAYVLYEPHRREFYLKSADRDSLCYCNDEVLLEPKKIQEYDRIMMGDTTFLLIAVCGEKFSWEE